MTEKFDSAPRICTELSLPLLSVQGTMALLAEGATVPFIARYRKEQTGGLDEVQIRAVDEKRVYYAELFERRQTVLGEIEKQGKLTPELRAKIEGTWIKTELEDLYLPYKPKRRTRATMAKERGLEPLALRILAQATEGNPASEAEAFVKGEVADVAAALAGARDIVAEAVSENPSVRALVRDAFAKDGMMSAEAVPEKTQVPTKFEAYYSFAEKVVTLPSHRFLAIARGEAEGVLRSAISYDAPLLQTKIEPLMGHNSRSPFAGELAQAVSDALKRLLAPSVETDVRTDCKLAADRDAVSVFAENVRGLLLAPPLGRHAVIGIDPGQRTGCKCVALDDTGKLLAHDLIYLVQGDAQLERAKQTLYTLIEKVKPFAIAVGNGTHGRETADFCRALLAEKQRGDVLVVLVSESGASVYSASDVAREEFPDLDLTVRGAISIARRLQDPLAELVKIDAKAIGVGSYQHDVSQTLLERKLDAVVESCVNAVGVELNMASAPLLEHVAGLGKIAAKNIVKHREANGAFRSRAALRQVSGVGARTFEQCAGFVRVVGGEHALDASAVHPERYALVEQIAKDASVEVAALIGNAGVLERVAWEKYVSPEVGLPTLQDIKKELLKPGRDPRAAFEAPAFRDDVRTLTDLRAGMSLEGVVTNVTAFGAFVDIGVHQDGLVHVSQLADRFVKDPSEVCKVGDKLRVRVLEVDLARKRISLSARSEAKTQGPPPPRGEARGPRDSGPRDNAPRGKPTPTPKNDGFRNNPFAVLANRK